MTKKKNVKIVEPVIKHGSTLFLRLAVLVLGLIVATLCVVVLPAIHREWSLEFPHLSNFKYPVILGIAGTAAAFFVALWQTLRLLKYVDTNTAFSAPSVRALRNIKYCALVIAGLYVGGMPLIYSIAQDDDAPGLILFGSLLIGAAATVAVFAAVLQRLLQNAIAIQSENDLTV